MSLDNDVVLQWAPELQLHLDTSGAITARVEHRLISCGSHSLAVLDAFSTPTSVSDAMTRLRGRASGLQDFADLVNTIGALYEAGVLRDRSKVEPTIGSREADPAAAPAHLQMLSDRVRTSSFLTAINDVVRPGDVVLDIGTGVGVLAIAAARAGAKHVYAIESSSMAESAARVVEANGMTDRITVIRGWSTQVTVPERADVLVSEIIGVDPLEERTLEVVTDARKRLLKRGACLIPSKLRVFGQPVTVPDSELEKQTFTEKAIRDWHRWYGIDFSPLAEIAAHSHRRFRAYDLAKRKWKSFSKPLLLAEVDFKKVRGLRLDKKATAAARSAGTLNGLIVHIELELGATARISTDPAKRIRADHWGNPVWMFREGLSLKARDRFEVRYRYGGMVTEVDCRAVGR